MDIVLPPCGRARLRWSSWSPAASGSPPPSGIYLVLRAQTFPVVLGLTFLSYAVNVYLFAMGRLVVGPAADRHRDGRRATPTPCPRRWC